MGPCTWDIDVSCCSDTWNAATPADRTRAQQYATTVLWSLTGRQFGLCAMTVRPCTPMVDPLYQTYGVLWDSGGGWDFVPFIWNGSWRNCGCGGVCQCRPSSEVWLPGPVAGITEVRVNNLVIDPATYRVDEETFLVRQGGEVWPNSQNLDNPASSTTDTFVVTYLRGKQVPPAGQVAAGILACEFLKSCTGEKCRLPARITSLTRQGVSMSAADQTIADGYTGINEVDNWVFAVNPNRLKARPAVWSPDVPAHRVTTWTA